MSSSTDPVVDELVHRYADRVTSGTQEADLDDTDLFDALDSFDDSAYRSARMQQLSSELKAIKSLSPEHGTYLEIKDEKQVLDVTTNQEHVVVHFFHADFARCKIMDKHLEILASRHIHTRFIRVNVDNCPFLVARLQVQVLPCVLPFTQGISRDRITGFDALGGDGFTTATLEMVLRKTGVIRSLRGEEQLQNTRQKSILGFADSTQDEEYDSDA